MIFPFRSGRAFQLEKCIVLSKSERVLLREDTIRLSLAAVCFCKRLCLSIALDLTHLTPREYQGEHCDSGMRIPSHISS
jgi:hypothetical protein